MLTVPPIPSPPAAVLDGESGIAPADDLGAWVTAHILAPSTASRPGPLANFEHAHLVDHGATIGWLWVTDPLVRHGRRTIGRAQTGEPTGDAWQQLTRADHLVRIFGGVPDFVITLDARFVAHALATSRPENVLALVEHELYHCAVQRDRYGAERFRKDGTPVWGMRAHDTEEFAGVVRRYGVGASNAGPIVDAADHVRAHGPDVAPATLDGICGTCRAAIGTTEN